MSDDANAMDAAADAARSSLMESPGETTPAMRQTIERYVLGEGPSDLEPPLIGFIDAIRESPADADPARLIEAGWSEDRVLEVLLVVASAEGYVRLLKGREAKGEP